MENKIASLKLCAQSQDGAKSEIKVSLGAPLEEADGTWSCELFMSFNKPEPVKIYGGDSMQALCLALSLLRMELLRIAKKSKLLFEEPGDDQQYIEFPFKAYFPAIPHKR